MKIIISPAKTMKESEFFLNKETIPILLEESKVIKEILLSKTRDEIKEIYNVSDELANKTYSLLHSKSKNCALTSYDGIQYKNLGINTLKQEDIDFLMDRLFILSALYGVLRISDSINFYRLDFDSQIKVNSLNLYEFWSDKVYKILLKDHDVILNLASNEYSKLLKKYASPNDIIIDAYFYDNVNGKLKEKGVYAKMARGKMVRYIAENKINTIEKLNEFSELGFAFSSELSNENTLVFIRKNKNS